jgi:hypothetical protein
MARMDNWARSFSSSLIISLSFLDPSPPAPAAPPPPPSLLVTQHNSQQWSMKDGTLQTGTESPSCTSSVYPVPPSHARVQREHLPFLGESIVIVCHQQPHLLYNTSVMLLSNRDSASKVAKNFSKIMQQCQNKKCSDKSTTVHLVKLLNTTFAGTDQVLLNCGKLITKATILSSQGFGFFFVTSN